MSDLLFDPAELSAARAIAVMVPGALSSINIFKPAETWRSLGYGLAHYRFPGLDGREIAPKLDIAQAATAIVQLAQNYPGKPIRLLGYSTGGPIVILAASQLDGDVKTAAMSTAVEYAGGLKTGLSGFWDIVQSAWRVKSLNREEIWLEYYKVLLFGRSVVNDADLKERAAEAIASNRDQIVMPDGGKPQAHASDLRKWRLPNDLRLDAQHVKFFVGLQDPVFSSSQTLSFAQKIGSVQVTGYDGHGHLLFLSHKPAFTDILDFFEGRSVQGDGVLIS